MSFFPRTRGGALWRFALAATVVIGLTATTTAVAGLLQVKQLVEDISQVVPLKNLPVKLPNPGEPQTILVVGSDHRAGEPYRYSNTDTMMLIRIDDSSSTINVMSIPRDLEVQLPTGAGKGSFKLNAAYSFGGIPLLIHTLQQQVFPGIVINHVLDVNFGAFEGLVDAIGCVYSDVDHRYYNNTAQTDYSSIDIQPGYQKLCDTHALEFVRFRHTDSDLVRNARQQDFIRWAKDQYGVNRLISNRDRLLKIFGQHVQTDRGLHSIDGLINLFNVAVNAGHEIRQIKFPALLQACGGTVTTNGQLAQTPCYVTAEQAAEGRVYEEFMTPTQAASATPAAPATPATPATVGSHHRAAPVNRTAGLTADPGDGRSQSAQLKRIAIPVYYPKLILAGTSYCFSITANCDSLPNPQGEYTGSYPRNYEIHAPGGVIYPSYRFTLVLNPLLGEYYGIQGTAWLHPPILNAPHQAQVVNGKTLLLYPNGHHLSLVAWRTPQAVYWISNTLTDDVPNAQLVGIAASFTRAP